MPAYSSPSARAAGSPVAAHVGAIVQAVTAAGTRPSTSCDVHHRVDARDLPPLRMRRSSASLDGRVFVGSRPEPFVHACEPRPISCGGSARDFRPRRRPAGGRAPPRARRWARRPTRLRPGRTIGASGSEGEARRTADTAAIVAAGAEPAQSVDLRRNDRIAAARRQAPGALGPQYGPSSTASCSRSSSRRPAWS